MGRPRLIIVIRHAQSEGNRNRDIHQTVPDHRVKLTPEGWQQAEDAGRKLRSMLRPDDTLQFYTSPYRRTRETTDGILRTLTADDRSPSPFPRQSVKVWEEPRLREQDFGNFQPCSSAMERMWQERADYGHFFYRIPDGESAADAYDRISGFNESLWRSFSEEDFPSVCILVTHGLMTRVFLMKWYHWSVEYFEDLRNVSHCEFVVMQRSSDTGKYVLGNELRTWSELKRRAVEEGKDVEKTKPVPKKRWGGCPDGCAHEGEERPKRPKRQETAIHTPSASQPLVSPSKTGLKHPPKATNKVVESDTSTPELPTTFLDTEEDSEAFPHVTSPKSQRCLDITSSDLPLPLRAQQKPSPKPPAPKPRPQWLEAGRDFGGSESGMATPAAVAEVGDGDSYGFPISDGSRSDHGIGNEPTGGKISSSADGNRKEAEEKWVNESGMGAGARADALGDQLEESDVEGPQTTGKKLQQLKEEERSDKSLRGGVY